MKLVAALPLVVVLVSICGAPTPASNSTISGIVFHDTNRNGARDSCDRPLGGKGVVLAGKDGRRDVVTDGEGRFSFEDVAGGTFQVRLAIGEGWVWPVTTGREESIEVDGLRDVEPVEIGSAADRQLNEKLKHVLVLVFEDLNGNGEVDADECPLDGSIVDGWNIGYDSATSGSLRARVVNPNEEGYAQPPSLGAWRQTLPAADGACYQPAKPTAAYGSSSVFQVTFGFLRDERDWPAINVSAFVDADGDGARDPGEEDVPRRFGVLTGSISASCTPPRGPSTDFPLVPRAQPFRVVPPGEYRIWRTHPTTVSEGEMLVATTEAQVEAILVPGQDMDVDFGFSIVRYGSIEYQAFTDSDGDDVWDDGELEEENVFVCFRRVDHDAQDPCDSGNWSEDGLSARLPPGDYELVVKPAVHDCFSCPSATEFVTITAGGTTSVNVPVDFTEFWNALRGSLPPQ